MTNDNNEKSFSGSSPDNEWNAGWDEYWDQDSVFTDSNKDNFTPDGSVQTPKMATSFHKEFENELDKVLREDIDQDFAPEINWGIIDDIKPTNLSSRLKSFLNAPFSTVLETKKAKTTGITIELPPSSEKSENGEKEKSERPRIQIHTPKIHAVIGDSPKRSNKITREESALEFNNLNNISRKELNEVNSLLEGSLGKLEKVKFDNEVVQDKNINFVAQEKLLSKKKAAIKETDKDKALESALSAEQTIASESHPGDTLVPGLNNIRFDLKSAQEASKLFEPDEINEALIRIPTEKARLQKEKANLGDDKIAADLESKKIGDALFGATESTGQQAENLSTTDDLLDSLLDEIDDDLVGNSFDTSGLSESEIESLGKDEIITEKNIIDDSAEAALEFMDSAAQEAESLFEDFFKLGTESKEKTDNFKVGYKDLFKEKWKDLKKLYLLSVRFIKDPKYFLAYFNITRKDIYVTVGLIFCLLTYTGLIHIQFLTEKFPMNF